MADQLYVRARAALLDAAIALEAHRDALVLVGAQAIYLHTGDADLAIAEYTTDADFTVAPAALADAPLLADLLGTAGFTQREHPGSWLSPDGIYVDLMVPEHLAGSGSRGARLGPHGKRAARRAKGLEGALVDRDVRTIGALDADDHRTVDMWVAGPGALLVAKAHKISERVDLQNRVRDKDALDVYRLLRACDTIDVATRLGHMLGDSVAEDVTRQAIDHLPELFGAPGSAGVTMAVRAAGIAEPPDVLAASLVALVEDLIAELQ